MKKKHSSVFLSRKHLIRIMKIYSLLICITISKLFSFDTYSQNISISVDGVTLHEAIKEIEENSSYHFFYNNNLIDVSKKVSLKANDEKLNKVLLNLFKETSIGFKVYKNQIVLFPRNRRTSEREIKKILEYIEKERDKEIEENKENFKNDPIQNLIKGVVLAQDGLPLPGVNVLVKGTSKGTQTDFDGNYSIQANNGETLVYSYVGYLSQERVVGNDNEINVTLQEDISSLDEVVVTGYAVQRKSRLTSSAVNVKLEAINATPRAAIQESIQGNVPGVLVTADSGQPGATPNVRIRGVGSFTASFPLYVIDGIQTRDASIITSLNPGDIKTLTVLKDAAATSIYGTRGANGVIVIQTKSGEQGKPIIAYSTQAGLSTPTVADRFKPLNTSELQELLVEGVQNAGIRDNDADALTYLTDRGFDPDTNTNWLDLLTQDGFYQQHDLSIRGGSENTKYYISGGYFNQEGVIVGSQFERMNSRIKLDQRINDKIDISVNLSYNKNISDFRPDGGAFANPVRSIYRIRPDISPFNDDGTFNFGFNSTHNPVAQAEAETRRNITHRILASTDLSYQILKGLSFESSINMNQGFRDDYIREPSGFGGGRPTGRGFQDSDFLFTWLFRNLLRYDISWADHSLTAFGGYELQKTRNKFSDIQVENIPDGFVDLNAGSLPVVASTNRRQSGLNSAFFNTEYSYADRYLISGSLRRDGSSTFKDDNQYGVFWSVGLGWNLAKEKFMEDADFVNDFKIRGSYGENGNDPIAGNENSNSVNDNPYAVFDLFSINDYDGSPGLFFSDLGNPNLKWEVNKPLNIGLDYSLFDNRLQGSFDWYQRETTDLIRARPISFSNGDLDIVQNIGAMENKGIELQITTRNIVSNTNGFTWTTSFNYTANENKVTRLAGNGEPIIGTTSIIAIGEDFETFYLPRYAGADPDNGNALWFINDESDATTNNYGDAEQVIIGNATPDFYAGFRNTFTYKGISLDFQLYSAWGGLVYDTWNRFTNSDGSRRLATTGNVSRGTYERRWQQPGDITDVPAFVYGNRQTGQSSKPSSRFVYDGSYIRLRDVTLAYQLPAQSIRNIGLSSARVYIKGNNLYTYIKDDRLERDPEAGSDGRLNQEIPISRALFLGVDLTF
ncbi:TonB-dependent receptor [Aquimarina celericrescens]|uniref:TonB-dependent receptor n=1 Tax=Aquimarina celericrescens TaxID=1964542 RepID=A0ABW5ATP7_9FLAO|nr:TonB-dependent receptor [Aquimarina celericrescens]